MVQEFLRRRIGAISATTARSRGICLGVSFQFVLSSCLWVVNLLRFSARCSY